MSYQRNSDQWDHECPPGPGAEPTPEPAREDAASGLELEEVDPELLAIALAPDDVQIPPAPVGETGDEVLKSVYSAAAYPCRRRPLETLNRLGYRALYNAGFSAGQAHAGERVVGLERALGDALDDFYAESTEWVDRSAVLLGRTRRESWSELRTRVTAAESRAAKAEREQRHQEQLASTLLNDATTLAAERDSALSQLAALTAEKERAHRAKAAAEEEHLVACADIDELVARIASLESERDGMRAIVEAASASLAELKRTGMITPRTAAALSIVIDKLRTADADQSEPKEP